MSRWTAWLGRNADGVVVIGLAVVSGFLGLADIMGTYDVQAAILTVLALLALTLMRSRAQMEAIERNAGEFITRAAQALDAMPSRDRLAEWQGTLTGVADSLAHNALIQVVPGAEIAHWHAQARRKTDRWVFKGGTGTYLRAVTLPECLKSARDERRPLKVQFEIIDPTKAELCGRYAAFRSSLAPGPDATGEAWTLDRTRKEAFATILAACWYQQQYTLLEFAGGLSSTMSTFRVDMSSSLLIITQEESAAPALVVAAGKPHYGAYERELQSSFAQARPVPLGQAQEVPLSSEPSVDEVRRLLARLGLALPAVFGNQEVTDIIRKAIRAKDPYGK
jgi:hypothetical protein